MPDDPIAALVRRFADPNGTALDVGANQGLYTRVFCECFDRVVAFEPNPDYALFSRIMLRGIRTTSDMEYEFDMSLTNLALDPGIETVFLMAASHYTHISGTLLRQIASFGGDLSRFVPPEVQQALLERARSRRKG